MIIRGAALAVFALLGGEATAQAARPYLERALEVQNWLRSCRVETEHGVSWPVHVTQPDQHATDLYSGTAGIVLFYLEAWHATGSAELLEEAVRGADHLIASLAAESDAIDAGLYTGVAGLGFVLCEAWKASEEERFRAAAMRCVALIEKSARPVGRGVEWSDVTDVISGTAGTGLFLLYAAREMGDSRALELATRAGHRLCQLGEEADRGIRWVMSPRIPRTYPNFSHGTAGVAYFLAELHRATQEEGFLDAALGGGERVLDLAEEGLVYHHTPGGEQLFYLGWCHGPPGTSRLYEALAELTGDATWSAAAQDSFDAVMASGIPGERTDGFWNNAGQCCGTAGVIDWLLATRPDEQDLLRVLVDDLDARATCDESGRSWEHAEHRVRPEEVSAQTGYMQGAAGIGLCLLHLDGWGRREPAIVFPDSRLR